MATSTGKRSSGRPRTRGRDYISDLGWSRLGVEPSEGPEIAEKRYFGFPQACCPRDTPQ